MEEIRKLIDICKEYCTGCGLCHSVRNICFFENEKGYMYPDLGKMDIALCQKVCPACNEFDYNNHDSIWGKVSNSYIGWSMDETIRRTASSGGVLTSLGCYLLDEGLVDGIIQTTVGDEIPYSTKTVISRTSNEVKKCVGSRYSSSLPLYNILNLVKRGERYAFIGKPCDVQSLSHYLKMDADLSAQILYLLSFFCAGLPSNNAQKMLLKQLGCENESECQRLDYRGNGWPGFAVAYKKDGTSERLSYIDSWGKILGRDVRKACKFCIDGIGEYADIVCADAWFKNVNGTLDFSEHNGRNAVFSRSEIGDTILSGAKSKGYIHIEKDESYMKRFSQIQRYQNERRGGMQAMIFAMKLLGKNVPKYNRKNLSILARNVSFKVKIKRFLGTMKRVSQGKL